MERPTETEYATFYRGYVALVPETDIVGVLEKQIEETRRLLASVSAEKESYRYAEGKWSIRQVLGHLVDAERVFGYRAFCFSRGEQASLPSFDENQYVDAARVRLGPAARAGGGARRRPPGEPGLPPPSRRPRVGASRDREREARLRPRPRLDHGGPPATPPPDPPRAVRVS